jgi:NlpC/P60 family protein
MTVAGLLLDADGRRIAQALAAVAVGLVVLLFAAICVPLAVLVSAVPEPLLRLAPPIETWQAPPPSQTIGGPSEDLPAPLGSGAVDVARHYLWVPYVFGGSDPARGLDCSGLVQVVFRQLGIALPRTAQLQFNVTARLRRDQLQPGDLVFFARTYEDPRDWITHVGIYIGDGLQINAPTEGQSVSIQPVFSGFWGAHFASGGRIGGA